jgi:CubicO group peptidase (beta-lactamase class C family)
MSKMKNRLVIWFARIAFVVGGLLAAIVGLQAYMSRTAPPLHPQPRSAPSVTRPEPPPQWSEAVDRARPIIRASLAEQNLPGLSVAVGVGGDIVWAEGFGWADIETRTPVTPDTRFRIGTASTMLTSAAVGVLLETNRLTLDEAIQTYVPQLPKTPRPVTLRQLMGPVSGAGADSGDERSLLRQRCERPVDALQHVGDREPPVGSTPEQRRSTYGWILVSAAVESAADQPFLTFMRDQIFQPLGMDNTGAESAKTENPERVGEPAEDAPFLTFIRQVILKPLGLGGKTVRPVTGAATIYASGFGYDPLLRYGLHVMPTRNLSCYAGSMAFFSTPSDLVRFGLAINDGALLKPATVQVLQTSPRLASGRETTQTVGHDGDLLGGKVVSLMTSLDSGIVVSVTSNASYADTPALALKVAEAFAARSRPPARNE